MLLLAHVLQLNPAVLLHWQALPDLGEAHWRELAALPWMGLIANTLLLTLVAASLAVGGAPCLLLVVAPWPLGRLGLRGLWLLGRLWPPPLTALLLLFVLKPGVLPAALALGLHNGGILGRLMWEGLQDRHLPAAQALICGGCGPRQAFLYGELPPLARPYLAYGAYRADVILRETVVVGLAGAAGLGSQLLESLSSFAWDQVLALVLVYGSLTLIGEQLSDRLRMGWLATN